MLRKGFRPQLANALSNVTCGFTLPGRSRPHLRRSRNLGRQAIRPGAGRHIRHPSAAVRA